MFGEIGPKWPCIAPNFKGVYKLSYLVHKTC